MTNIKNAFTDSNGRQKFELDLEGDSYHRAFKSFLDDAWENNNKPFTPREVQDLFRQLKNADFMTNKYADNGCESRRSLVQSILTERGLNALTARVTFDKPNEWIHHEAAATMASDGETYVFDTALCDAPMTLDEWKEFINETEVAIREFEDLKAEDIKHKPKTAMRRLEKFEVAQKIMEAARSEAPPAAPTERNAPNVTREDEKFGWVREP